MRKHRLLTKLREELQTYENDENLATPFKPVEKYGIASTAFAAIMATESEGVTKNLTNKGYTNITLKGKKRFKFTIKKGNTTFYQVPCCDLHHHQQQHQTLGAHLVVRICPIPYEQPTLSHKSNWGLGVLLQSLPISNKSSTNQRQITTSTQKIESHTWK